MAKLVYSTIMSLDGYIEDENGAFDWAVPDEEVHAFINELERAIGTYLYGRRIYEVMAGWETMHTLPDQPSVMLDFAAVWQAAGKVVYSRTLEVVTTSKTRIEREFDPDAVRQMKAAAQRDLSIGGPGLASYAFSAGLVDECHVFVVPTLVGGGKQSLPRNVRLNLDLQDERRFRSGVVYLHYLVRH